jgi:hypothetical protein
VCPARRRRLVFLLLFGGLLALQVWRLAFTPHGLATTWTRSGGTALIPATGHGVTQEFLMGADGLAGVRVQPVGVGVDDGDLTGTVVFTLADVTTGVPVPVARRAVPAAEVVAAGAFHFRIPEVRASRNRRFALGVQHVGAADDRPLRLRARRDDAHPHGRFVVDGQERWGALVFDTVSRRATLPFWTHEVLRPWPSWVRSWWTVAAALLLFNAALAWASAVAVGFGAPPAGPAVELPGPADEPPDGRPRRIALLATCGLVLAGTVIVLLPQPEHQALRLIDHLGDAEIRSSWPTLRQGVAVQAVALFGPVHRALVALPTSALTWTVDVPPGAHLRGGVAMRPDVWTAPSDGANLEIFVEDQAQRTLVARFTLAPYLFEDHRRLFPIDIPLEPWAGRRVTLTLATDPERWGNAVNDVPLWVEPRMEWPRK